VEKFLDRHRPDEELLGGCYVFDHPGDLAERWRQ
jgi:hypothetical protein